MLYHNPLSANPEKWSNTLKQFVGNLPTNCLSVFDHFMNLALKGIILTNVMNCAANFFSSAVKVILGICISMQRG